MFRGWKATKLKVYEVQKVDQDEEEKKCCNSMIESLRDTLSEINTWDGRSLLVPSLHNQDRIWKVGQGLSALREYFWIRILEWSIQRHSTSPMNSSSSSSSSSCNEKKQSISHPFLCSDQIQLYKQWIGFDMKLYKRRSLQHWLLQPPVSSCLTEIVHLSFRTVQNLVSDMAFAITCLQKLGICHLDIKPENFLVVNDKGRLKLADFATPEFNHILCEKQIRPFYRTTTLYQSQECVAEWYQSNTHANTNKRNNSNSSSHGGTRNNRTRRQFLEDQLDWIRSSSHTSLCKSKAILVEVIEQRIWFCCSNSERFHSWLGEKPKSTATNFPSSFLHADVTAFALCVLDIVFRRIDNPQGIRNRSKKQKLPQVFLRGWEWLACFQLQTLLAEQDIEFDQIELEFFVVACTRPPPETGHRNALLLFQFLAYDWIETTLYHTSKSQIRPVFTRIRNRLEASTSGLQNPKHLEDLAWLVWKVLPYLQFSTEEREIDLSPFIIQDTELHTTKPLHAIQTMTETEQLYLRPLLLLHAPTKDFYINDQLVQSSLNSLHEALCISSTHRNQKANKKISK